MIFAHILEIVALIELASVMCARKFSFIIIIFKALKLAAAVFMYFLIWPPPRDLSIARLFTYNFQTPLWIFLMFGMEVVLMVLFEKIILYMPGKFWYGEFLAME